jgi:hypothetical protein
VACFLDLDMPAELRDPKRPAMFADQGNQNDQNIGSFCRRIRVNRLGTSPS